MQFIEDIFNRLDQNRTFYETCDEVAATLNASKPTVVGAFQDLVEREILVRIKNGCYQLSPQIHGIHDTTEQSLLISGENNRPSLSSGTACCFVQE